MRSWRFAGRGPLATARVRYHSTTEDAVVEIEDTIDSSAIVDFFAASDGLRLSACAASFAEVLRGSIDSRNECLVQARQSLSGFAGDPGFRRTWGKEQ